MRQYSNTVTNSVGVAVENAAVTVYDQNGAKASLYSDNALTVTTNPLYTDANGDFSFYIADGTYDLEIVKSGTGSKTLDNIVIQSSIGSDQNNVLTGTNTVNIRFDAANTSQSPNASAADAMTFAAGERYGASVRSSNITANDVYDAIFPNINHYDCVQGVTHIISGSTIEQATGLAGYVKSDDAATANGVAVFGCAMGTAQDSAVWGMNTLLQDNATRATHARTGQYLIGYECDLNVMGASTEVIGISCGGNSLAQPTSANAFICNVLGTGIEWTTAFNSQDGAAVNALNIGMLQPSGNDLDSQKLLMSWSTSAGTKKTTTLQVDSFSDVGYLIISSTGSHALKIANGNLLFDTGQGVVVNGNTVLTDRKTGWTDQTAAASRADLGASPTAAALASAFRALYDDLKGHGIIGN